MNQIEDRRQAEQNHTTDTFIEDANNNVIQLKNIDYQNILREIESSIVDLKYYSDEDRHENLIIKNKKRSPEKYPLIISSHEPKKQSAILTESTILFPSDNKFELEQLAISSGEHTKQCNNGTLKSVLLSHNENKPIVMKSKEEYPSIVITCFPESTSHETYNAKEKYNTKYLNPLDSIHYNSKAIKPCDELDNENPDLYYETTKKRHAPSKSEFLKNADFKSEYMKQKMTSVSLNQLHDDDDLTPNLLWKSQELHNKKLNFVQNKSANYNPYIQRCRNNDPASISKRKFTTTTFDDNLSTPTPKYAPYSSSKFSKRYSPLPDKKERQDLSTRSTYDLRSTYSSRFDPLDL